MSTPTDDYTTTDDAEGAELGRLLDVAARAAAGDSNDEEFDALNEALDHAVGMLTARGVEVPREDDADGSENDEDEEDAEEGPGMFVEALAQAQIPDGADPETARRAVAAAARALSSGPAGSGG